MNEGREGVGRWAVGAALCPILRSVEVIVSAASPASKLVTQCSENSRDGQSKRIRPIPVKFSHRILKRDPSVSQRGEALRGLDTAGDPQNSRVGCQPISLGQFRDADVFPQIAQWHRAIA